MTDKTTLQCILIAAAKAGLAGKVEERAALLKKAETLPLESFASELKVSDSGNAKVFTWSHGMIEHSRWRRRPHGAWWPNRTWAEHASNQLANPSVFGDIFPGETLEAS